MSVSIYAHMCLLIIVFAFMLYWWSWLLQIYKLILFVLVWWFFFFFGERSITDPISAGQVRYGQTARDSFVLAFRKQNDHQWGLVVLLNWRQRRKLSFSLRRYGHFLGQSPSCTIVHKEYSSLGLSNLREEIFFFFFEKKMNGDLHIMNMLTPSLPWNYFSGIRLHRCWNVFFRSEAYIFPGLVCC